MEALCVTVRWIAERERDRRIDEDMTLIFLVTHKSCNPYAQVRGVLFNSINMVVINGFDKKKLSTTMKGNPSL